MQSVLASEVFVFDAYCLIVVRTGMRSARTARTKTLRIDRDVSLHGNGRRLSANPVGTGSHRGHATILLRPCGDWGRALESLAAMLEGRTVEVHHGAEASDLERNPLSTTMRSVVLDTTTSA